MRHALLLVTVTTQLLHYRITTFDFGPEACKKIECVGSICDRKFASVAGSTTEQYDLAFGIDCRGMAEARLRHVAEYLELLK